MAKKKIAPVEPLSGRIVAADAAFSTVCNDVERKMGKHGMLIGTQGVASVLPYPSLAMRLLSRHEGLVLGRCYLIIGPAGSMKSTLLREFFLWVFRSGGYGQLNEAETKPATELQNAIWDYDLSRVRLEDCEALEDWQCKTTWFTMGLQKRAEMASGPGRTVPFISGVDSLTGKNARSTQAAIKEDGCAKRRFSLESQLISDYYKAYPSLLIGWPFVFAAVNHMKIDYDTYGNPEPRIPGGDSIKFQNTLILIVNKVSVKSTAADTLITLRIQVYKNSCGPERQAIEVRLRLWYQEDAPGVMRLHGRFEWWESSIMTLLGTGMKDSDKKIFLPQIEEVIDIREKAGGARGKLFWSKRLGVSSDDAMTAHELGVLLEQQPDVLADIYRVMRVQRYPFFQPGIDYAAQQESLAYIRQQAESAEIVAQQTADLLARGRAAHGIFVPPPAEIEDE